MAELRIVRLVIDSEGYLDGEELDEETNRLRQALLELDVENVVETPGTAPDGAKVGEAVTLGTLLVSLLVSSNALGTLVDTVQWWLAGSRARSVKLELDGDVLEVSSVSRRQQRELIDLWIQRRVIKP